MDSLRWSTISEYDFDDPLSEYSFSNRLSNENYWSADFTSKAILEYKKFMYLAAISNMMVSPSEIIDKVWHQHLVFSTSYQEFCSLLGKDIQHIPSTNRKEEHLKFKKAKQRTDQLYNTHFNEQPRDIWGYPTMYDSLKLTKARFKIRSFLVIGLLVFFSLITPFVILLKPIYSHIENPDFLVNIAITIGLLLLILEIYNHRYLKRMLKDSEPDSFLYHLNPSEVIYLKTQDLAHVIHNRVNCLVLENLVSIDSNQALSKRNKIPTHSFEEFQVLSLIPSDGQIDYQDLLRQLALKPIFWKVKNSMDALKKYIVKSYKFGRLFYLNFIILAIPVMLALSRLIIGLIRQKPITYIGIMAVLLICLSIYYLYRLTQLAATRVIPALYTDTILPAKADSKEVEWQYFLLGTIVLAPSFTPVFNRVNQSSSGGDSGSSDSSCSSDGGSSGCGGCGGD